jgi:hypothetical protein
VRNPFTRDRPTLGRAAPASELTWKAVTAYYPEKRAWQYFVPLPERGLIYVKNPKAGSSTMMLWLHRLHTGDPTSDLQLMHREHQLPRVRDVGRRQVVAMLRGSAYRFSFVRHPVRRLESVYWAKMVRSHGYRLRAARALGFDATPDTVLSFETFLAALERQDPLMMDAHWRPQHLNLLHPLVTYDRIGRLESFDADLARICEEAGLPPVPVQSKNVSPRKRPDSVYDGRPDLVRRVEDLYAKDFELYGY